MLDDLTDDESALAAAAHDGRVLDCAGQPVRAELIRELLLGRRGELDPRGVRLRGARVVGTLELDHVTAKVGLELVDCDIEKPVDLSHAVLPWLRLAESRLAGLNVVSARIGGDLDLFDTTVHTDSGPAIYADGVHVEGTIVLVNCEVRGHSKEGAIWLLGARLDGLRMVETQVTNDVGPAVFADELTVRGHMLLQRATLSGHGTDAALLLAVARVDGRLTLHDMTISNPDGPLLDLHEAEVGGRLRILSEVICPTPASCERRPIDINGLRYGSLAGADWRQWLHLIRCHTKEYRPSPYQNLAAVERAAGHDGNARNVLIAQQQDLRRRAPAALGGWLTQRFHWLWGALAGYGYRARRTAVALLVALAAAGGVAVWAGHAPTGPNRYAAEHTITSAAPRTPCSTVELIGLGLDRGLPLAPTGLRSRCDLDTESTAGQAFTVLLWIVQAAVWGLATLALAGYTGLIRKTA